MPFHFLLSERLGTMISNAFSRRWRKQLDACEHTVRFTNQQLIKWPRPLKRLQNLHPGPFSSVSNPWYNRALKRWEKTDTMPQEPSNLQSVFVAVVALRTQGRGWIWTRFINQQSDGAICCFLPGTVLSGCYFSVNRKKSAGVIQLGTARTSAAVSPSIYAVFSLRQCVRFYVSLDDN